MMNIYDDVGRLPEWQHLPLLHLLVVPLPRVVLYLDLCGVDSLIPSTGDHHAQTQHHYRTIQHLTHLLNQSEKISVLFKTRKKRQFCTKKRLYYTMLFYQ